MCSQAVNVDRLVREPRAASLIRARDCAFALISAPMTIQVMEGSSLSATNANLWRGVLTSHLEVGSRIRLAPLPRLPGNLNSRSVVCEPVGC
jgi:hypothetical protein